MALMDKGSLRMPSPVDYRLVLPARSNAAPDERLLLLCLHGGVGGHDLAGHLAPIIEEMWAAEILPEMVIVVPEAHHSFYLDYRDGSQKWETFLTGDFLLHLSERFSISLRRDRMFIAGISMGGMGALRIGLKYLDLFGAVVAWEPSIEPAFEWKDVKLEDRFWRSTESLEARYGRPIDEVYWADNNPATIARDNATAIRESGIHIYLEVGSDDAYGLDRGAEFMHRTLFDQKIKHEYRYVYGADHVGSTVPLRLRDGIAFLAKVMQPRLQDVQVEALRHLVAMQKRRCGVLNE
jgi:S-formylglutathione hydrolase